MVCPQLLNVLNILVNLQHLVLIIKFKIHAIISILLGAITIGIVAGMPFEEIVTAVNDGISNTLKGIALLVGLGSMFGAILESSGGAQMLAVTMIDKFGDEKAAEDTIAGLKSAEGYIRRQLAHTVNLRNTPEIRFILDQSIAYGVSMSHLIDEVIGDDEKKRNLTE